MPDWRSLGQLAYEDYVRKAGVGGRVLGWGAVEQRTRSYWEAQVRQEVRKRARDLWCATRSSNAWEALPLITRITYRTMARADLRSELIIAAQNEEALEWARENL